MKKTNENLMLLNLFFCISIVIANVVGCKVVDFGFSVFGHRCISSGGALTYAVTFLCTDIIGEIWGKHEAHRAVRRGLLIQVFALLLIIGTQFLRAVDPNMQAAYETLLGQSWCFVIGSLTAYLCSQSWDVFIFHRIREKLAAKPKLRWIWNNASTMTSQIIDTFVYAMISFGIGMGWLWHEGGWGQLLGLMIGQYGIKFLLALLDTPFFYIFTRKPIKNTQQ